MSFKDGVCRYDQGALATKTSIVNQRTATTKMGHTDVQSQAKTYRSAHRFVVEPKADIMAVSHLPATSSTARAAAEGPADRKELKYQSHARILISLASTTLGPNDSKSTDFDSQLGRLI